MISLKLALKIASEKEGYERCFRSDHGLNSLITINGITKPAKFVICPIIQFYPKPTFLFHSIRQFCESSERAYQKRGGL